MAVKEHNLGEGTLAYHGHGADYWRAKAERLPHGRTLITRVLLIAGALVALAALSPLGPQPGTARVISVRTAPAAGSNHGSAARTARVHLPDGRDTTVALPADAPTPSVGGALAVTSLPGGRVVAGHALAVDAWVLGGLLLLTGGGRLLWQLGHRGEIIRFR